MYWEYDGIPGKTASNFLSLSCQEAAILEGRPDLWESLAQGWVLKRAHASSRQVLVEAEVQAQVRDPQEKQVRLTEEPEGEMTKEGILSTFVGEMRGN